MEGSGEKPLGHFPAHRPGQRVDRVAFGGGVERDDGGVTMLGGVYTGGFVTESG